PDVCLTDGFPVPGCARVHRAVVGGDGRSAAIAAASIVAKVTRARFMSRIAPRYPGFGFEQHVGYITPEHTRAVRELGPTPLHRRSFEAIAYAHLDLGLSARPARRDPCRNVAAAARLPDRGPERPRRRARDRRRR